ncbi:MAG TPA: hypothetical protein VMU34_15405 [Mycobacterium sp.]|nr:hypothetical protein [Mycobacterium sp.]
MTEPDHDTRPISVAELLARNGTIGAPPVGGRRRRRRGNSDAVTVAELTGEIPAVRDVDHADEVHDTAEQPPANGTSGQVTAEEPPAGEPGEPVTGSSVAEQMRPDPVVDDQDGDRPVGVLLEEHPAADEDDDLGAYLQAIRPPLFGEAEPESDAVALDEATEAHPEATTAVLPQAPPEKTTAAQPEEHAPPSAMHKALRAGLTVLQSILAVAFGAGLFIAFDQLWRWNNIVALVLAVLVIIGLVVAVRVVRKTEDLASTLIAVAVGALVTMGPLVLLQSG